MKHTRHASVGLPFAVGTLWVCAGRIVQIDGPLSLETLQVRDTATGSMLPVPIHDLKPLPSQGAVSDPLIVSEHEWKRSLAIAQVLEPYRHSHALPSRVTRKLAGDLAVAIR